MRQKALLNGLTAAGKRSDYAVVTGISTGALMTPLPSPARIITMRCAKPIPKPLQLNRHPTRAMLPRKQATLRKQTR